MQTANPTLKLDQVCRISDQIVPLDLKLPYNSLQYLIAIGTPRIVSGDLLAQVGTVSSHIE